MSLALESLGSDLRMLKAFIEQWQGDVAGNLKPLPSSLETGHATVRRALDQVAKIQSEMKEAA